MHDNIDTSKIEPCPRHYGFLSPKIGVLRDDGEGTNHIAWNQLCERNVRNLSLTNKCKLLRNVQP